MIVKSLNDLKSFFKLMTDLLKAMHANKFEFPIMGNTAFYFDVNNEVSYSVRNLTVDGKLYPLRFFI